MDGYERLLKIMRYEGAKKNPPVLTLGEMTGSRSCRIGFLELDADDLYIAEHLLKTAKKGDLVVTYRLSDQKYVILEKVVNAADVSI